MTLTVTDAQLDSCTRVIDETKREAFYLVQSATDVTVTYQVRFNRQFGRLSCQRKANQHGIPCWHIKAAVEAGRQYAEAKRGEAQARQRIAEQAMLTRMMNAKPAYYTEDEVKAAQERNQPNAFSILR